MIHGSDMLGAEIMETRTVTGTGHMDMRPDRGEQESILGDMVDEAVQWRETNLEQDQNRATKFYLGEQFGDEREGRSRIVMTVVRDVVHMMLPSLMRIFFGPERVVEFKPSGPEDEQLAEQQTDYVNFIITEDNPGFTTIRSVFLDALIRKLGIAKWWWEEDITWKQSDHEGLSFEQAAVLAQEGEARHVTEEPDGTISMTLRRRSDKGRVKIMAIPPEEFIYSPLARSIDDAIMVGHIREVPANEVIGWGADPELVSDARGASTVQDDDLARNRRQDKGSHLPFEDAQEESTRNVPIAEIYAQISMDGDEDDIDAPVALHKCMLIGGVSSWKLLFDPEVVDEAPFAKFTPFPEPHTMEGQSIADLTMDLQKLDSQLWRGLLDSLSGHIDPATEVVEHEVNMADVLNQERGRVIRVRRPGMMREVPTEFVGASALPVLQLSNDIQTRRTGISKASQGLDADALQSSTRAAVAATLSAAQQQIEIIARTFAEVGMKRIYKGVNRLTVKHQDQERVVRLRNAWVPIDPRHWNADMDVRVNIPLGSGSPEEKLQLLGLIADKQEQHLLNGSPMVTPVHLRNTYAKMIELAGWANTDQFFASAQEIEQKMQASAQQQPEPTADERLERIEMAKLQQRGQTDQAKLTLEARQQTLDYFTGQARAGLEVDKVKLNAALDTEKLRLEREKAEISAVTSDQ